MDTLKKAGRSPANHRAFNCRFHDLRHTACTDPLESGVPFAILAQIMTWCASATITLAKRYGHFGDSVLRTVMSVLDFLERREDRRKSMTEKSPELARIAGGRSA